MEVIQALRPGDSIEERYESADLTTKRVIKIIQFIQPTFPYEESLGSLRHPCLQLTAPISVLLSRDDDHVVAECREFDEFGYGHNTAEAIKDLQETLVELYFTLRDEQEDLGSKLSELWDKVRAKIKER